MSCVFRKKTKAIAKGGNGGGDSGGGNSGSGAGAF